MLFALSRVYVRSVWPSLDLRRLRLALCTPGGSAPPGNLRLYGPFVWWVRLILRQQELFHDE
jgi:hypothetical protein